jgi:hypothetical protein
MQDEQCDINLMAGGNNSNQYSETAIKDIKHIEAAHHPLSTVQTDSGHWVPHYSAGLKLSH